MNTEYDFGQTPADRLVYVRPVKHIDLPEEVQDAVPDSGELYAVYNSKGEQLALVNDRKMAFVLARQNNLAPVSVH